MLASARSRIPRTTPSMAAASHPAALDVERPERSRTESTAMARAMLALDAADERRWRR
jgi:hypothetical protein